jgi:23S rRNA (pseudouridine1915-N3)-methyltransferase
VKIKIIAVGRLKEKYLTDACAEYVKRLAPYASVEIIEIPEACAGRETAGDIALAVKAEGAEILKRLGAGTAVVLDLSGENLSSPAFSEKLTEFSLRSPEIRFVIGGAFGLSGEVVARAGYVLSFGGMTFPHQLIRVMLLEQIYRAVCIKNHHPYHK